MIKNEGILPVDKERGVTSFYLVKVLRSITKIKKIGHAGILDPFATGVMILLIGKPYTKIASTFIDQDKEYMATLTLGISTDTYDCDGQVIATSDHLPSREDVERATRHFQGTLSQIPPMYSAKKVKGQKLYLLARQGIEIKRDPIQTHLKTEIIDYNYPELKLKVTCSKGTYIRTLAHDLGQVLKTEAHLSKLVRTRSGSFKLKDCIDSKNLSSQPCSFSSYLRKEV